MPMRSCGAFGPEAIADMDEILDAAFEKLQDTGEPDVVRERIATRIMAAARLGKRDPAHLLEAALRRPDGANPQLLVGAWRRADRQAR
jgi:hypothetical protein